MDEIPIKCSDCVHSTWLHDDIVHCEWWCMIHNMSCEYEHNTCEDKKEIDYDDIEY